jgi:hypothetical protein
MTLLTTVGPPEEPLQRRKRRLGAHHAALALQRVQKRGLLAADIGARTHADLHVEAAARAHHVAQKPAARAISIARSITSIASGYSERGRHSPAPPRPEARDHHPLDQREGIALHQHPVGEGA